MIQFTDAELMAQRFADACADRDALEQVNDRLHREVLDAKTEVDRYRAVVEAAKHQRDTWNDYMNGDKAALVESVMESQMRTGQALAALAAPPDAEGGDVTDVPHRISDEAGMLNWPPLIAAKRIIEVQKEQLEAAEAEVAYIAAFNPETVGVLLGVARAAQAFTRPAHRMWTTAEIRLFDATDALAKLDALGGEPNV